MRVLSILLLHFCKKAAVLYQLWTKTYLLKDHFNPIHYSQYSQDIDKVICCDYSSCPHWPLMLFIPTVTPLWETGGKTQTLLHCEVQLMLKSAETSAVSWSYSLCVLQSLLSSSTSKHSHNTKTQRGEFVLSRLEVWNVLPWFFPRTRAEDCVSYVGVRLQRDLFMGSVDSNQ